MLKHIFKGAATTVITQRKDPLYADYEQRLACGTKPTLARLTLARSIAATVLCMWKNEETYEPEQYRRSNETDRTA